MLCGYSKEEAENCHERLESDLETTAGGHDWTYFDRMAEPVIQFVAERLEAESQRV